MSNLEEQARELRERLEKALYAKEEVMSLECSECERDLRGGHDKRCSRYVKPCDECLRTECDEECDCKCHAAAVPPAGEGGGGK